MMAWALALLATQQLLGGAGAAALRTSGRQQLDLFSEVYVTMLNGKQINFLPGLQALAASVRAVDEKRPFLVMVTDDPIPEVVELQRCLNLVVVKMPYIHNPMSERGSGEKYETMYCKIAVWALGARRAFYIDSDAVVLKRVDKVFSLTVPFAAAPDCGIHCLHDRFNAGVLAIAPSKTTFHQIVSKIGFMPSYDGGDQGFLNTYFYRTWKWDPRSHLPQMYNTLKRRENQSDFNMKTIRVLHNVGDKPWWNDTSDNQKYSRSHRAFRVALGKYMSMCSMFTANKTDHSAHRGKERHSSTNAFVSDRGEHQDAAAALTKARVSDRGEHQLASAAFIKAWFSEICNAFDCKP